MQSKFRLDQKIALVTGGGSGIGQAIALTLAAAGARVHVLEVEASRAVQTLELIQANGGQAQAHSCDVTNWEQVQAVFSALGPIDILINNAGIAHIGTIEQTSPADMDRVYAVNVKGVYHCIKAAIPLLKARGKGVILNMASIASSIALKDRFAYSMSKGAVLTMTYSVAKDYLADHIRCNSISPARIHTPFVDNFIAQNYPGKEQEMFDQLSKTQPIGRMGSPQEVADLTLFLCSDEAGFITGTDFPIDGGFLKLQA